MCGNETEKTVGDKMLSYLAVIGTVLFTVGGQLLMKWRVARLTPAADGAADRGLEANSPTELYQSAVSRVAHIFLR
jgi:hypothetical protein